MPFYEYECFRHGKFEEFFRSFSSAKNHIDVTPCPICGDWSDRVASVPLEATMYGDPSGYGKPSATKRHSTKLVSAKTGNQSAIG